jgi:hypothetical protein
MPPFQPSETLPKQHRCGPFMVLGFFESSLEDEEKKSIRNGMGKEFRTIKDYTMRIEDPNVIIFICEKGGLNYKRIDSKYI